MIRKAIGTLVIGMVLVFLGVPMPAWMPAPIKAISFAEEVWDFAQHYLPAEAVAALEEVGTVASGAAAGVAADMPATTALLSETAAEAKAQAPGQLEVLKETLGIVIDSIEAEAAEGLQG